ncbi:hypothetical protein V9T40_011002 [Parthenolecanium corni]|uniref:Lipid droplet-associated hydrolase n=1 Tax=Parthenolecanium corni TaxID=536013 RepID=A0AAN9TJ61_9HEMI
MACKDDWVLVDDMPTRFITWGAWIDDLKDGENLILLIPGNPGLVDFYREFLKELHEKLQIPVWAVSHLGHEMPPKSKNMHYTHKYNLQDQIDHKITIIRKYVPQNCKLFVIAHSMGAKITQEMLKEPDIEQRIATSFMLFPTVERIGDTPNARFVRPMIQYMGFPLVFLSLIFTCLPRVLRAFMLSSVFSTAYGAAPNHVVEAGLKLVQPTILGNVFHLFKTELNQIKELDVATLNKHKKKLKFYYGTNDGWSPLIFYENLIKNIPDMDAVVCQNGMSHAFSIRSAPVMAGLISQWIEERKAS